MKNKNKYLLVIGILLFVFIVIGVSYSYFQPRLTKINDTETVIKTNELGLVYTGPNNVSCTNMIPGDKCIKHFTIENTSEVAVTYNIYMEQITNEFNEDLVYTLTDNNGSVVEETYLPKTNDGKEYIKINKTQEAKTTKNYTITVEYKYTNQLQNYQGAEFRATIGMDTKQFIEVANCANYSCENEDGTINNGGSSINGNIVEIIGTTAIVDLSNPINPVIQEIEDNNTTTYGSEQAISHDIYYSDEAKYSNGLNERYTTYCTPYENNKESGVIYCTRKNRKGTCKKTTKTKTCTYEKAKTDLGLTTFKYQSKRENFADKGNGNWHIQTYCEAAKKETAYEGGYYYCDKHEDLHDWYDMEEPTAQFKLGDYVKMTPTLEEYTIPAADTGYTSAQTINPSELNIWRIISINEDGTVDAVSEYISSIDVILGGTPSTSSTTTITADNSNLKAYANSVGTLNKIASSYTNSNYVVKTRHMGYGGGTSYITDTTKLVQTPKPWAVTTSSSTTPEDEALGAGDMGYEADYNLVKSVLGKASAYKAETIVTEYRSYRDYWLASRCYKYYDGSNGWSTGWGFKTRFISNVGTVDEDYAGLYGYSDYSRSFSYSRHSHAIRPIITLKSGLTPSGGDGKSEDTAWVLN